METAPPSLPAVTRGATGREIKPDFEWVMCSVSLRGTVAHLLSEDAFAEKTEFKRSERVVNDLLALRFVPY